MSTLEATVSMLEVLPDSDVQLVFNITRDLLERKSPSPFGHVSKEQVLRDLEESTLQIQAGEYSAADDVIDRLRSKYGI